MLFRSTEVTKLAILWTRTLLPLMLSGVLENIQVCAQVSSKITNGNLSLCFITRLFRFSGHFRCFTCFMHKLSSGDIQLILFLNNVTNN